MMSLGLHSLRGSLQPLGVWQTPQTEVPRQVNRSFSQEDWDVLSFAVCAVPWGWQPAKYCFSECSVPWGTEMQALLATRARCSRGVPCVGYMHLPALSRQQENMCAGNPCWFQQGSWRMLGWGPTLVSDGGGQHMGRACLWALAGQWENTVTLCTCWHWQGRGRAQKWC